MTLMVRNAIATGMPSTPHGECGQAADPMQKMVGHTIGPGWRVTIEKNLGGVKGCTHLRELLFNMATAAFQSRSASFAPPADGSPPMHLGKCLAWDFNGPVVEKVYPMFFRWQPPGKTATSNG